MVFKPKSEGREKESQAEILNKILLLKMETHNNRENSQSSKSFQFLFLCLWHEVLTGKTTASCCCFFNYTSWQWFSYLFPAEVSQERAWEDKYKWLVSVLYCLVFNQLLHSFLPMADAHHGPSQEGAHLLCPEGVGAGRHAGQQRILKSVLNAELLKLCSRLRNLNNNKKSTSHKGEWKY